MKHNVKQVDGQMSLYPEATGPAPLRLVAGSRDDAPRQDHVILGGEQLEITDYFHPKPLSPNELVEKHMNQVEYMYNEPWRHRMSIPSDLKDELFAEGYLALVKAANGFDPGRGVQFKTYASAAIRYAMQRKIRQARRDTHISLYSELDEGRYLLDTLSDAQQQDPDTQLWQQELQDHLLTLLERFNEKKSIATGLEALILQQQGYNSREIGEQWGKTANYVTAVISRTRRTLASELSAIRECA